MPRMKPTTKIDVIGNLDLSPDKAVDAFFESKLQDQYFVKPPNWDTAGDTVELLHIRNKREHNAMLRLQEDMLETAKQNAVINANRNVQLHKQQTKLRKRLLEVNNFIKDCSDKRQLSEKKVEEELKTHTKLQADIVEHTKSIEELIEFRNELKKTVLEFEPYESVVKEVVEMSDIFESVKDCMARCDALMLAQVEIQNLEYEKLGEIEEIRKTMVKVTNEAALTMLGLKNELSSLERAYLEARGQCRRWDRVIGKTKTVLDENNLETVRTLSGIHHMYHMLTRHRQSSPHLKREEVEKRLDYIKDEFELITEVLHQCQNHTKSKGSTHKEVLKDKC